VRLASRGESASGVAWTYALVWYAETLRVERVGAPPPVKYGLSVPNGDGRVVVDVEDLHAAAGLHLVEDGRVES
jgi:hypothetical protein